MISSAAIPGLCKSILAVGCWVSKQLIVISTSVLSPRCNWAHRPVFPYRDSTWTAPQNNVMSLPSQFVRFCIGDEWSSLLSGHQEIMCDNPQSHHRMIASPVVRSTHPESRSVQIQKCQKIQVQIILQTVDYFNLVIVMLFKHSIGLMTQPFRALEKYKVACIRIGMTLSIHASYFKRWTAVRRS